MDQQQVEGLVELSGKILDALSKVDEAVRVDTQDRSADNRNTEAIGIGPNMMSGTGGIRAAVALNSIRSTRDEDYRRIAREPFVARVVVENRTPRGAAGRRGDHAEDSGRGSHLLHRSARATHAWPQES